MSGKPKKVLDASEKRGHDGRFRCETRIRMGPRHCKSTICLFPKGRHPSNLRGFKMFDRWRLRLIDRERLRVGGYLMSASRRQHLHFHVLMIGQNRFGKTLLDCNPRYGETQWRYFARIQRVENVFEVSDYIGSHFEGWKADYAEPHPFNSSLLRQAMRNHSGFISNYDELRCIDGREGGECDE